MADEDLVQAGYVDGTMFINGEETAITDFLTVVDAPLQDARDGDFDSGFNTIRSMTATGRAIGWALARLIHGMYTEWVLQEREPERFWQRNLDEGGLKRLQMERYIDAWNAHLGVPEEYAALMLQQPIKNAIQLGSAMAQGYEPSDKDLKALTTAESFAEFSNTLRGVTNREPRSNSLRITMDMNTGDLTAFMGNERMNIGYLNVQDLEHHPITKKAIERIMRSAGIMKG